LRQVYLDTVVFSYHQLAYLLNVFGPDRILMGTDYPYDMAEYNPIGHIAGVDGMDETTLAQLAGGNATRSLDRPALSGGRRYMNGSFRRILLQKSKIKRPRKSRQSRSLDFSAAVSLFSATPGVRDRFWMKRYGPSRRRA
jgi:hypothetical protein